MAKEIDIQGLQALGDAAEAACHAAYRRRNVIDGAINWADLHCVSVECGESLYYGEVTAFRRVWIEEANENNQELKEYIAAYLAQRGFPDIEVRTEW
jgi:hypothetical protein